MSPRSSRSSLAATRRRVSFVLASLVLGVAGPPPGARGEGEPARTIGGELGSSVEVLRVARSDAAPRWIVIATSPFAMAGGLRGAGRVTGLSATDGGVLWGVDGAAVLEGFGTVLCGTGDLDGDGGDDFAVGAPGASPGGRHRAGSITVHSGSDGSRLRSLATGEGVDRIGEGRILAIPGLGASKGAGVLALFAGDAHEEAGAGAGGSRAASVRSGALAWSAADGRLAYTAVAGPTPEWASPRTCTVPDEDGDRCSEWLVTSGGAKGFEIRSGLTGAILRRVALDPGLRLTGGLAPAIAGPQPGTAVIAVTVVSDGPPPAGSLPGEDLVVLDLASGRERARAKDLPPIAPGSRGGRVVRAVGDLDGDGVGEFALGTPGSRRDAGRLDLLSGRTLQPLWTVAGRDGEALGAAVAVAGDVNGDGVPDIAVGAPRGGGTTARARGRVYMRSGKDGGFLWMVEGDAWSME